jgi:hypothetical protein
MAFAAGISQGSEGSRLNTAPDRRALRATITEFKLSLSARARWRWVYLECRDVKPWTVVRTH